MNPILIGIIWGIIGYLLGSLSFSRIFLRILAPEKSLDNLEIKMDNSQETEKLLTGYGANRVSMILGAKWGIIIAIFDMLKVIAPLIILKFVSPPNEPYFLVVAVTGLIGHNWPIYYRFKGGKGFSVIIGSFIVIDWFGALMTTTIGIVLGMSLLGNIMIAYISWLWLMIPWFILRTPNFWFWLYAFIINIIFLIGIIPEAKLNIRLRREGKYDEYKKKLYESSPRWRGMKKMEEKIKSFGIWRFIIGIAVLALTIWLFFILPSLNF